MYCKKCGKEIGDDIAYCPFCGSPTHEEQVVVVTNTNEGTKNDVLLTVAKVFLIISAVIGAILIFPLVLGILSYKACNKKDRESLLGWSIVSLILVNFIAGICMLVWYFINDNK